jgi:hypothetical protein
MSWSYLCIFVRRYSSNTSRDHKQQQRKRQHNITNNKQNNIDLNNVPSLSSITSKITMKATSPISFCTIITILSLSLQESNGFLQTSGTPLRLHVVQPSVPVLHPKTFTKSITCLSMNQPGEEGKEFKLNKPIDLPSLNPQDAGPMYATCRSVTGLEPEIEQDGEPPASETETETEFKPNKPIELESLEPKPTFFGLEPKDDNLRMKDGSMTDSGLPLFTGTVIMMLSVYFIYLGFFGEDIL